MLNFRRGAWPGRIAAISRICLICSSGVLPSLHHSQYSAACTRWSYIHFCIDDPIKVFFSLFTCTRASLNAAEELRVPIDTIAVPFGCFFSLPIFNPCFVVGSCLLVFLLYCLSHDVP